MCGCKLQVESAASVVRLAAERALAKRTAVREYVAHVMHFFMLDVPQVSEMEEEGGGQGDVQPMYGPGGECEMRTWPCMEHVSLCACGQCLSKDHVHSCLSQLVSSGIPF